MPLWAAHTPSDRHSLPRAMVASNCGLARSLWLALALAVAASPTSSSRWYRRPSNSSSESVGVFLFHSVKLGCVEPGVVILRVHRPFEIQSYNQQGGAGPRS